MAALKQEIAPGVVTGDDVRRGEIGASGVVWGTRGGMEKIVDQRR